uniref:Integral membrane protein GPR155 n=1 Tax=Phallusia mammillata TaxID=59560 RepID=A0A6F9DEQ7_9ASCI|nr:integral membrane protein GPR155 [Phallusia mammillata]
MIASHLTNLFNAIFNCFMIIICGYAAGRLSIITPQQGQGIGNFVGTFSLPAMLFKNMVQLNFARVNWSFMLAVLLSKTVVFVIVLVITLLVLRRKGIGRAALYAIFATQSNDFAMGYPIVAVLYKKSYPEFLQYIYLLAPISLLILNPIGFMLLEIDKHWKAKNEALTETQSECEGCPRNGQCIASTSSMPPTSNQRFKSAKGVLTVIRGLLLNPIVVMVFVGLIFHFIFKGKLPLLLNEILTTLSNAFSATALFYLGTTMVGKLNKVRGVALLIPLSLIAAKILLLPILARETVYLFSHVIPVVDPRHHNLTTVVSTSQMNTSYLSSLANFGFLYGTIPTAPTVVIYAAKYSMEVDRLASGMVICTTLSAPIMYVSAWTLTITSMKVDYYKEQVLLVDQDVSIVGMLCAVWCVCLFIATKKFQRVPHLITLVLSCTMFLAALMTVISSVVMADNTSTIAMHVVAGILYFGVTSTRLLTASLAVCVTLVKKYGETKAWAFRWILIFVPTGIAVFITLAVTLFSKAKPKIKPVFLHAWAQDVTSFTVLLVSLLVTCVLLVMIFRAPDQPERAPPSNNNSLVDSEDQSDSSESNQLLTSSEQFDNDPAPSDRSVDSENLRWWEHHKGDPQITRHLILLLFLCVSLFIGVVLTGWRVNGHKPSGIYFEISFLDSVFNFGQAFFVFLIFGLDSDLIIDPFIRAWRKLTKGHEEISLTPLEDVDREVLRKCLVFVKHHLRHCKRDVLRDGRRGLRTFKSVMRGSDLCTWLVEVGLSVDRQEAVKYGQDLMMGRVLSHVSNKHYFYDKSYLYRFEDYKISRRTRSEIDLFQDSLVESPGTSETPSSPESTICRKRDMGFSFVKFLTDAELAPSAMQSPTHRRRRISRRHTSNGISNGMFMGGGDVITDEENDEEEVDETSLSAEGDEILHKSSRDDTTNLNDW